MKKSKWFLTQLAGLCGTALLALTAAGCGDDHGRLLNDSRYYYNNGGIPITSNTLPQRDFGVRRPPVISSYPAGALPVSPIGAAVPGSAMVALPATSVYPVGGAMPPPATSLPPSRRPEIPGSSPLLPQVSCTDPAKDKDGDGLCDQYEKDFNKFYPALQGNVYNGLNALGLTWPKEECGNYFCGMIGDKNGLYQKSPAVLENLLSQNRLSSKQRIFRTAAAITGREEEGMTALKDVVAIGDQMAIYYGAKSSAAEAFPGFQRGDNNTENARAEEVGYIGGQYTMAVYEGWLRFPEKLDAVTLRATFDNGGNYAGGFAVYFSDVKQPILWAGANSRDENSACEKKLSRGINNFWGKKQTFCNEDSKALAKRVGLDTKNKYFKLLVAVWKYQQKGHIFQDSFQFTFGIYNDQNDLLPLQYLAVPMTALYPRNKKNLCQYVQKNKEANLEQPQTINFLAQEELTANSFYPPLYLANFHLHAIDEPEDKGNAMFNPLLQAGFSPEKLTKLCEEEGKNSNSTLNLPAPTPPPPSQPPAREDETKSSPIVTHITEPPLQVTSAQNFDCQIGNQTNLLTCTCENDKIEYQAEIASTQYRCVINGQSKNQQITGQDLTCGALTLSGMTQQTKPKSNISFTAMCGQARALLTFTKTEKGWEKQ